MSSEARASEPKKILIIGGGIAGLCAGVYARKCGYAVEVLEMNTLPGGLAMSWRRGEYTFETCLHWLVGSRPGADLRGYWEELFDISALHFVDPEEVARIETESGESLAISIDPDRLEATLLARSPADAKAIRAFVGDVRRLGRFRMPYPGQGWAAQAGILLRDLPIFPTLRRVSKMTCEEYGARFQDPLIRAYFGRGELAQLSAVAVVFSLAWMSVRNAGYAVGGAQAIIRPIEQRLKELGGSIRYCARVERILVENGAAVGVQLAGGETLRGDWVISAADGHTTLNEMLGGAYTSPQLKTAYEKNALFPSYLQVSLGVGMDLSHMPRFLTYLLDAPLQIDPKTSVDLIALRFFHFDPTFAPAGKTAVICFLPTYNDSYWEDLRKSDMLAYRAEKQRVAEAVIERLERRVPGLRPAVETVDVSSPATVLRFTGNWKGSMEGWLLNARHRIPSAAQQASRPAALPDGRPVGDARRWIAVRPLERTPHPQGDLPRGRRPLYAGEEELSNGATGEFAFVGAKLRYHAPPADPSREPSPKSHWGKSGVIGTGKRTCGSQWRSFRT